MVEYMARQKELSGASIQRLLKMRQRGGKQTPQEQRTVIEAIAARFGLKIRPLKVAPRA
jgi:hypothetical protein